MLAVVYVLRLEDLARDLHAHTIAAGIAKAMGGEGDGPPSWDELKASFDADLAEVPESEEAPQDRSSRAIKLRALGFVEGR